MSTQTGSISFEATGGFNSYAKQNYATLSQIKGQFATCGTGANTAEKAATIIPQNSDWMLYTGATVTVKFTSKNTAVTPTLNVNHTGAKEIRDYNGNELTKEAREWPAGAAMALTYDGTYWRIQDSNLMERMYSAETAITQNANAISLSATKEELNNLQVGGRNYILNSKGVLADNRGSESGSKKEYIALDLGQSFMNLPEGTQVTVSFDLIMDVNTANPTLQVYNTNNDGPKCFSLIQGHGEATGPILYFTASAGSFINERVSVTGYIRDRDNPPKDTNWLEFYSGYGTSNFFSIANLKLEKGNKATDWTPAPEDVEAYMNKQVSDAKLEINANGIRSEVSKITSAKYVNSLTSSWTLASIKTYAAEGHQENWNVTSTENFRVGDTIYIKGTDSTRNCPVYIKTTIKTINSAMNFTGISHGYEDVLPVDTIKSTINQSSDTVKIQAKHIEIDGTATFKNSDNTITTLGNYLSNNYDEKGAAATVQNNLNNLQIGGRNLLRGTGTGKDWTYTTFDAGTRTFTRSTTVTSESWITCDSRLYLMYELDTEYTISCYAKSNGQVTSMDIYTYDQNTKNIKSKISNVVTTNWEKYTFTFKYDSWQSNQATPTGFVVRFDNNGSKTNDTEAVLYVRDIKLEKGNKATDWSPAPEDTEYSVNELYNYATSTRSWYATCSTAAGTVAKVATIDPVTSDFTTSILKPGTVVFVKFTTTNSGAVGDLTLNINGTGAKPIKQIRNGTIQTIPGAGYIAANSTYQFTYDGTNWLYTGNYDSNSNDNARYVQFYNTIVAGEALHAASIIGGRTDGKFYQIKENSSFDLSGPLLWLTADLASGATDYSHIYTQCYDRTLATYYTSFTNTTANKIVFLVGTVNGNTFNVYGANSNSYLTVTIPTTENGLFYIPIGRLGNQSNGKNYFNYQVGVPITLYAYVDGKFRQVTPTEIVATQKIYYRSKVSGNVPTPKTWITSKSNIFNDTISVGVSGWSTKVTPLSKDKNTNTDANKYLYLYTCEQRKRLDGTIECIPTDNALLDDSTTVIDGGNIITGTVTANQLDATNINASKILTVGSMTTDAQNSILNSNIEIGGRNLALNSASWSGTRENVNYNYMSEGIGIFKTSPYGLNLLSNTNNTNFMVSFDWIATNVTTTGTFTITPKTTSTTYSGNSISWTISSTGNSSGHVSASWTPTTANRTYHTMWLVGTPGANTNSGMILTINNFKFEKGNKATSWSPAPEDVDAAILSDGRNRLRDTSASINCSVNTTTSYQTFALYSTDGNPVYADNRTLEDLGFKVGDSITLSFDWTTTANGSNAITYGTFWIEWYGRKLDGSSENGFLTKLGDTITMTSSANSGHYSKTVELTSTSILSKRLVLRSDKSVLVIKISNLKLERGPSETAWTPALEDATSSTLVTQISNFNDFTKTGNYYFRVGSNTNAPVTNQGMLEVNFSVGTPYQVYYPDNLMYYYKRTYTSNAWSTWTKIDGEGAYNLATTANNKALAWYGISGGEWNAAAKTATVVGFTTSHLVAGTTIMLRTSGSNNVANALTLNVQSTGAKPIYVGGQATSATNQLLWHAGAILTFTYTGSAWEFADPPNTVMATRITDAAGTANKLVYSTQTIIRKGTILSTAFAANNTHEAPSLGVAVNSNGDTNLGWKPIYYGTSTSNRPTAENGMSWIPNTEVLFTFDGANWRMGGKTYIDGGHILTESISADKIKVSSINIGDLSGTIGGKNLALDSDQPYNWQKYTPTTYEIAQVKMTEDFIPGETYTVTIWGGPITRSDKSNCWYALYWGGGNFSLANATLVETGVYRATFTISTTSTAQHTATGIGILDIYNTPGVGASGTTYSAPITKIQIEKGNVGTEWEPAQEELPRPNLYKPSTEMGYIGSGAATLSAYDDSYHGRTLTITTAGGTLRMSHIIPKTNVPYTVSFILDASVATTITVDIMDNTTQAIKVPKGISKVIFTSTPTRTLDSTYHFIDMVFANAGTYKMEDIKVEPGTVPTAWISAEQVSNFIYADSSGINIASANPSTQKQRIWLTNSRIDFYNASNTSIGAISGDAARFGPQSAAYINIDGSAGITLYDTANKKRTAVDGTGLHIYGADGSTEVATFASTATIGTTTTGRVTVTATGVGLYNKNNKMKVSIGTGNSIFYGGEGTYPYIELGTTATSAINIKQSATSYTSITSSGLDIYTTVNSAATKIATFGTTVRLGQSSNSHIDLDYHSLQLIDKESNTYFYVSDLRDSTGYATLTESFIGDGTKKDFLVSLKARSTATTTATVDGTSVTVSSISEAAEGHSNVTLASAPGANKEIKITYQTNSSGAKAYTLGTREGSGFVGAYSYAEGYNTIASGNYSHAEGGRTTASGNYSHAQGDTTTASGRYSHAEGYKTVASGYCSHAEGDTTTASDQYSHVEGRLSIASGFSSHAEGDGTKAKGYYSHAEGSANTASGDCSHVEGRLSIASGYYSHAEGENTEASGRSSHAEGENTKASGRGSHAGGSWSIANGNYMTAIGKCNKTTTSALFVVGNGTSDTSRADALVLNSTGTLAIGGDFTFGDGTTAVLRAKTPSRTDGILWVGGGKKAAGDVNGTVVRLQGGGLMMVGSGEYPTNRYNLADLNDGDETLFLGSDGAVYVETNGQTIANRKTFTFGADGTFNSPSTIKQNGTAVSLSGHTHSYLPLSGGTMSGGISMAENRIYWKESGYGDQFAIVPYFSGADDANLLKIQSAVGAADTTPTMTDKVTISGKTGNVNITTGNLSVKGSITQNGTAVSLSGHNHEIQNLTNFGARVYDATGSRTKNTVLAAPNGSNGAATFRALVAADIPSLAASKINSGTFDAARIPNLAASKITSGTLSVAHGGTGKTAGTCYMATSLYENTSGKFSGAIDLSETAANFTFIEIYCKDNDGRYCYTKVWSPNGKTVNVTQTLSYGGNFYIKSKAYVISGTGMDTANTSGTYHTGEVNAAGNNSGSSVDNLGVVKVIGYK